MSSERSTGPGHHPAQQLLVLHLLHCDSRTGQHASVCLGWSGVPGAWRGASVVEGPRASAIIACSTRALLLWIQCHILPNDLLLLLRYTSVARGSAQLPTAQCNRRHTRQGQGQGQAQAAAAEVSPGYVLCAKP